MRLLLDTHAFVWFCEGSNLLSMTARSAIEDAGKERFVSHATAWEISIKLGIGKLKLRGTFEDLFPGVLSANGFLSLPSDYEHYRVLLSLRLHHRDPFDRLACGTGGSGEFDPRHLRREHVCVRYSVALVEPKSLHAACVSAASCASLDQIPPRLA